jgi:hypothetical protein
LPELLAKSNADSELQIPLLAALLRNSAFGLAFHDARGKMLDKQAYESYGLF